MRQQVNSYSQYILFAYACPHMKQGAYRIKLLPEQIQKSGYFNRNFVYTLVMSVVNLCLPEFLDVTRVFLSGKSFMQ